MANQKDFDLVSLRAKDGPAKGDYYGLPWPCWGTPEFSIRARHTLYNTSLAGKGWRRHVPRASVWSASSRRKVVENGQEVEREQKFNMLSEGSWSKDSEIQDGYPEFTLAVLKKLGWDKDLTEAETGGDPDRSNPANPDTVSWSTDLLRRHSARGDQARLHSVRQWQGAGECLRIFPDAIPVHREPIYSPRPDLVAQISDAAECAAIPSCRISASTCRRPRWTSGIAKQFPLDHDLGPACRIRRRRRRNPLQQVVGRACKQDMFVEINPADAAERGIKDGGWVWVTGPKTTREPA